ncbi:Pre-mRNA-splicing regulator female-lethal(2)D [Frankliniella fusca]|uniref:Pre-mRNA-splicing regulator female-lethal(2)D n=1 Tax=Frankliniella fusca TaxID=407009 RepID=A0AAE1L936_9NEOP|nr:Pre-mRNA-splicing regulator female-lethal(2)D [Frankliniella fusca]
MSEDSRQSIAGALEEEGSPCTSPTPSLTPSLPASIPASTTPGIPTAPDTPCSEHSAPGSSTSPRSEIGEPPRPRLTNNELESVSLPDLIQHWKDLDIYTDWLDNQANNQEVEIASLRNYVERAKQQHLEACARERAVIRRLATKEQEVQELMAQITDLKTNATPSAGSLRSAFLDPAVNLLLQKLRTELATARAQLEETQNELSAWKFTPDSNTGKRLMAKCRQLYQENEELGKQVASGRVAKLEGELALQKSFSLEVKKSQSELDEFLQELDEDVEGMQSTVYYLQQELRKSRETISSLERKLSKYCKVKAKGKNAGLPTDEEGNQIEEEVKDEDENECESEAEDPKDWKETGENDDGEEWGDWKEGEEGEEDWHQWEEEEEEGIETDTHVYQEEESTRDWLENSKEPTNGVDVTQDSVPGDSEVSSQNGGSGLKRTKSLEDSDEKFDTPMRKKIKPYSSGDIVKDCTIAEGLDESTNENNDEIV